jgi:N-acetylglucosaminyldiphosphoundecaprenol N-acetyl-beta-D-mannosaminyltransferase
LTQKPAKTIVLGIPVSSDNFRIPEDLDVSIQSGNPVIITFVNPHACALSESHREYLGYLHEFDWVLCDGTGMAVAARRIGKIDIKRVAFDLSSIARPVCAWLAATGVPLVLVGSKPGVTAQAAERLRGVFPTLNAVKTFNGYDDDPRHAMNFIADNPKAAVICGMGAPRQEKFLIALKNTGWTGIGFTCGGFFDHTVERVEYYPGWVEKMDLRFLYRLVKEPRRLWRRYLVEYQVFIRRFLKESFSS